MTNHPNRSRRAPSAAANPAPADIRAAREAAGLSQTDAAALIWCGLTAWQRWEAGQRRMHPAMWFAFQRRLAEAA
jgi:DNA-binding transcriptional regulator YiaG